MASNSARILIQFRPGTMNGQFYPFNAVGVINQVCIKRNLSLYSVSQVENKANIGSSEKFQHLKSDGTSAAEHISNTANAKVGEMNKELQNKGIQANERVENANLNMESATASAKQQVLNIASRISHNPNIEAAKSMVVNTASVTKEKAQEVLNAVSKEVPNLEAAKSVIVNAASVTKEKTQEVLNTVSKELPSLEEAKSMVVNAASLTKEKAKEVLKAVSKEVSTVQDVSGAVKKTLAENIQDSVEKTKIELSNANATRINGTLQKVLHFFRGHHHPNAYEPHPLPQQGLDSPRPVQGSRITDSKTKL